MTDKMPTVILLFIFIISCSSNKSDERMMFKTENCEYYYGQDSTTIYTKVESWPQFNTGIPDLVKYLITHLELDDSAIHATFRLIININKYGEVYSVRIANKRIEEYTQAEQLVINTFIKMPKWKPAYCNGSPVQCEYPIPIRL